MRTPLAHFVTALALVLGTASTPAWAAAQEHAAAASHVPPPRSARSRLVTAEADLGLELAAIREESDLAAGLHGAAVGLLGFAALSVGLALSDSGMWAIGTGISGLLSMVLGYVATGFSGAADGRLLRFERLHPDARTAVERALADQAIHARNLYIAAAVQLVAGAAMLIASYAVRQDGGGSTAVVFLRYGSILPLAIGAVLGVFAIGVDVDLHGRRDAAHGRGAGLSGLGIAPLDGGAIVSVRGAF